MDAIQEVIDSVRNGATNGIWSRCSRTTFSDQLEEKLSTNPYICQGPNGYYCGTAAALQQLMMQDPILLGWVAADLFNFGKSERQSIKTQSRHIHVTRVQKAVFDIDPFDGTNKQSFRSHNSKRDWNWVDWVLLTSFRSKVAPRLFGKYIFPIHKPSPTRGAIASWLQEGTTARQAKALLGACGFYIEEGDVYNSYVLKGRASLDKALTLRKENRLVNLFVNSGLMTESKYGRLSQESEKKSKYASGTHWIVLGPGSDGAHCAIVNDLLQFDYIDYGSTSAFKGCVEDFLKGYYGYVSFV